MWFSVETNRVLTFRRSTNHIRSIVKDGQSNCNNRVDRCSRVGSVLGFKENKL
jgi:hypothetical protein